MQTVNLFISKLFPLNNESVSSLQAQEDRPRSRRQSFEGQDVNALGYEVTSSCDTFKNLHISINVSCNINP